MVIGAWGRSKARGAQAHRLYLALVAQARAPAFYADCGVPDTLDGRFDMIVLHVVLVIRRLRAEGIEGKALAQALFDVMIDDMDRSLREMGVGDLGVGRRVKAMAKAFYGRAAAYEAALAEGVEAVAEALGRNLFRGACADAGGLAAVAGYVCALARALDAHSGDEIAAGEIRFPFLGGPDQSCSST